MLYRVIDETEAPALVAAFMERYEVVAPVKRGNKYVFSAVDSLRRRSRWTTPRPSPLPRSTSCRPKRPLRVRCRKKRGDRLR
ncbi:MAG: hypothetical protein ACLTDR_05585 [Adlercreutzia equolifaciens]